MAKGDIEDIVGVEGGWCCWVDTVYKKVGVEGRCAGED